ncbi:MAG: tetratricopeptide repeat protein [Thermodesulfobacteriota bacterium]
MNRAGGKLMSRGRFAEALSCFYKALDFYGKCGQDNKQSLAALSNNIGHAYVSLQKPEKALLFFSRAAELREALGDTEGLAWQHANVGSALRDLGDFREAARHYLEALMLFESAGASAPACDQHANLGYALAMLGDTVRAIGHYEAAVSGYSASDDRDRAEACKRNIAALRGAGQEKD